MQFGFNYEQQATSSVDIDHIGNCALMASNDNCEDYFLVIKTVMGKSSILQFGPICEQGVIPEYAEATFNKIDYNEGTIKTIITKFINNLKRGIEFVEVIDMERAYNNFKDLTEYLKEGD